MTAAMKLNYDPKELARELNLHERTAALIVALRTESGLAYEEIETRAGIPKEELMSWESGAKSPRLSEVAKLACHCGASAAVNFHMGFNKLLRESQMRIAELQNPSPQRPLPPCVRRGNFFALGAVGGIRMAA